MPQPSALVGIARGLRSLPALMAPALLVFAGLLVALALHMGFNNW